MKSFIQFWRRENDFNFIKSNTDLFVYLDTSTLNIYIKNKKIGFIHCMPETFENRFQFSMRKNKEEILKYIDRIIIIHYYYIYVL